MQRARRLSLGALSAAALTLGLLLSSCGASSVSVGDQIATASAATATADARVAVATAAAVNSAALPTATMIPASVADVESAGCPSLSLGSSTPRYSTVSGLTVSNPQLYTPLNYPSAMLPSNAPNAPYKVPLTASEAQQVITFHPNPSVNPSLDTGYVVQVCNQTTVAHTVSSIDVNIAGVIPSSGPVAVWHLCQDGPYDAATRQTTGGCGGSAGQVDWLAVNLPSNSTGAGATAVPNASENSNGPELPLVIVPNKSVVFLVAVHGLITQGTYTLSFGIGVDDYVPVALDTLDATFFIAPSPTVWTGTACQTPAMQAQIPAASTDTFYVCPPAP